jgi:hypothetical protein
MKIKLNLVFHSTFSTKALKVETYSNATGVWTPVHLWRYRWNFWVWLSTYKDMKEHDTFFNKCKTYKYILDFFYMYSYIIKMIIETYWYIEEESDCMV